LYLTYQGVFFFAVISATSYYQFLGYTSFKIAHNS